MKVNQHADILAVHRRVGFYAERGSSTKQTGRTRIEPATYSAEDLARIDELYATQQRRGRDRRYWEDVEVGESLPPMPKGPTTTTDIIRFHSGGYFLTDLRTSQLAYQNRPRKPGFYVQNAQGIPDVVQRGHWDPDWARSIGHATPMDYGAMREFWLHHYLTDWAGDDGWIVAHQIKLEKFAYLGDFHTRSGEITAKRADDEGCLVEVALRTTNQRQVDTAVGTAVVALPSRQAGAVVLPVPPLDLRRRANHLLQRHAELSPENSRTRSS